MNEFNPYSLEPFWDTWYIDSLIGEGSFGAVYKIYREEFGTKYYSALKIISIPKTATEEKQVFYDGMDEKSATQYFREIVEVIYKEIAIMAELKGKTNIVSYEDHKIIQKQNGVGYHILIRMELLESLNDYILYHKFTNADVVNLGKDMCRALILCQKRNLIHRDIKPANVFVSSDGDYKLGDFGIARQLEGAQDGLSIKGTYGYMAPEVYLGNVYDERVDIYSLGMVLYYYLNDKKGPFSNTTSKVQKFSDRQESLRKRFSGEKLPTPVLASEHLSEVVLKACEYDPKNRYETPEDLLAALEALPKSDLEEKISIFKDNGGNTDTNTEEGTIAIDFTNDKQDMPETAEEKTQVLLGAETPSTKEDDEKTLYMIDESEATVYIGTPDKLGVEESGNNPPKKRSGIIILSATVAVLLITAGIFFFINKKPVQEETNLMETETFETIGEQTIADDSSNQTATAANNTAEDLTPTPDVEEEKVRVADYILELDNSKLENCSSIDNISMLTSLSISFNKLSSLEELKDSVWLEYLNVQSNKISELDALSKMVHLTCLNAMDNQISDVSPIGSLTSLEVLILSNNRISSVDDLIHLEALIELRIDGNRDISDISAISHFKNLKSLTVSGTGVKDITSLYELKNLTWLDLSNTDIPVEQINKFKSEVPDCEIIQ